MILVNGKKLEAVKFPNGEQKIKEQVVHTYDNCKIKVVLKWESDQDLINLMFIRDDIGNNPSELEILYMPYSRMDRYIPGDMFTLKSVCNFINYLNFDSVLVHEPHSDVTPALLNNCIIINTTISLFNKFKKNICKPDFIFYPDAGAQKRYYVDQYPILVGHKIRNRQTGRIEKYDVLTDGQNIINKTIVILDDLSSYGGTFTLAAKKLKELGVGDIYLIVAHAEKNIIDGRIFSDGCIKRVLTTNSIIDKNLEFNKLTINKLY